MNMRLSGIKRFITTALMPAILYPAVHSSTIFQNDSLQAVPEVCNTAYQKRLERRKLGWEKLIPDLTIIQYAGDIGMISLGLGWDYGKSQQWETHILFGYLPKRYKYNHYWTFTLRETYLPWDITMKRWHIKPLSVSLAVNSILHEDFWTSQPDRYPSGYYEFSTKLRFHIGIGQRFSYDIPEKKRFMSRRISFYYEISTCDLYIYEKIKSSSIPLKDILILGAGLIYTI